MTSSPHDILRVCCVCRLIHDDRTATLERWVTKEAYCATTGINPSDCLLTHTYCPECHRQFLATIKAA